MRRRSSVLGASALMFATVLAACSTGTQTSVTRNGKLAVVAAESSWGSITRQLGGDKVDVKEIVNSPDADPHDYEPTPADRATWRQPTTSSSTASATTLGQGIS